MKKIAKLSLVAAVAVAGLTTANAQQLEDAIKKVEVSGSVVYRYNDYNNDINDISATNKTVSKVGNANNGTEANQTNHYKVGLNLAAPVNDFVKLNTRFLVGSATGDFAALETSDTGDSNVDVELSNVYFGYTGIKNTTVNVGKQGLTTPWTVATQIDGNEQTGTGILALSTFENVTLAAAYFNQTNLDNSGNLSGILKKANPKLGLTTDAEVTALSATTIGAADIATVGVIVAAGPATIDAWYADMQEVFDTYTIGTKGSVDVAGITLGADARYTSLSLDRNVTQTLTYLNHTGTVNLTDEHDDNSLAKLTLTAKSGILSGKAVYGKTGKDGGLTALDNDASTTLLGWSVTSNGKADADFYQLVAAVDILPELNLSANYVNVDYTNTIDRNTDGDVVGKTSSEEEEIYAQLTYKMSKNLVSYIRYGVYTKDDSKQSFTDNTHNGDSRADAVDDTRGRIQVAYTF